MKVISLRQPWASLVVLGAKKIETRSFNTKYRGEILIHASAKMDKAGRSLANGIAATMIFSDAKIDELPLGKIIGKVTIEKTGPTSDFKTELLAKAANDRAARYELDFGDYSEGRYGWLLQDAKVFETPVEASGTLGFWNFAMCKICGCHELDACSHPDFGNCWWMEEDLCSHCLEIPGEAVRYSKKVLSAKTKAHA